MQKESDLLFYQTSEENIRIEVLYRDDSFWMTQKKIAKLFRVQRPAITKHLSNIFKSEELIEESVCSKMEHTEILLFSLIKPL